VKANVEEQAFHQAGEHDQRLQQGLIGLSAGFEIWVGDNLTKGIRNWSLS
jgi:hypothetical protein